MLEIIVVYRKHFLDAREYDRYIEHLKATGCEHAFIRITNDNDSYTILEYRGLAIPTS